MVETASAKALRQERSWLCLTITEDHVSGGPRVRQVVKGDEAGGVGRGLRGQRQEADV